MKKLLTSMFLVFALLALTAGTAFAQDAAPITGTVQTVVIKTDATTGDSVVVVTLLDETTGTTQTVNISLETAITLGLVTTDPTTGESTVTENAVGATVEIDPTTVIPEENTEENQHPVGSALSNFFGDLLGVDYETIMTFHDEGIGFGVIAQALWVSNSLGGGSDTFEALLEAKQSGDYSAITLPDGTTPDNWGDIVRSRKKGENLGSIMSHKAKGEVEPTEVPAEATTNVSGNGNGNGNNGSSNGNGNGQGNNNSNGGGNNGRGNGGNNNGNGNGNH